MAISAYLKTLNSGIKLNIICIKFLCKAFSESSVISKIWLKCKAYFEYAYIYIITIYVTYCM